MGAIGHIVVVYLSRLFHRFWPTSLTLLVVVLHEPGPDRRQDDFLETGRTQLHSVLSDCRAGRAEKPEAWSEGRGGQEGRRHDQDEEVDRRQTRGICEALNVRLTHREPGPSDSPQWL